MEFLSYLISGISLGSIYAIIALGYTMVYGIAKMLNFAHGDIIMIGGYVSFCAMYYMNLLCCNWHNALYPCCLLSPHLALFLTSQPYIISKRKSQNPKILDDHGLWLFFNFAEKMMDFLLCKL